MVCISFLTVIKLHLHVELQLKPSDAVLLMQGMFWVGWVFKTVYPIAYPMGYFFDVG